MIRIAGNPISVSVQPSGPIEGRAAIPVAVVDGPPVAGVAQPVYVVTSGPVEGSTPIPVTLSAGGPALAGAAIPVYVVSGSLGGGGDGEAALGVPSFAAQNTTVTNDLSPDGWTWDAVGGGFVIDQYGKYIAYQQRYNSNTRQCYFVTSNNKGATWVDNTGVSNGEGFLVRGSIVYDAGRDCLHSLLVTTNAGDGGIIYRRYSIARDGSNNITSIARVGGVSVSLDSAGDAYEFPTIIMTDADTLVASWTVRNILGGEIRAVKCDISGDDDAGGSASNWVHIGINSTTLLLGSTPHTASYSIIYTQALANVFTYFSMRQLASGDLGWFYHSGSTPGQWRWRRSVKSGATWGSLSSPVAISNMQVAGTDTGYGTGEGEGGKVQLCSKVVEDDNGNVYCAAPVWASNATGDTVLLCKISSSDTVSSTAIYSAGGKHSYAPTCGLGYDEASDRLIVSYIDDASAAFVQLHNPTDLSVTQGPTLAYDDNPVDIPLILFARDNGKCGMGLRVQGAAPQAGVFGTLVWS
jgi:hypothetical protein